MIHDWELYSVHQEVDPAVVRRNTEMAQGMVTWMRTLDLSPREPTATDESTEAHDCEDMLLMKHTRVQAQSEKCTCSVTVILSGISLIWQHMALVRLCLNELIVDHYNGE